MITLITTITLYTIIAWIIKYAQYKKFGYTLNIFKDVPNAFNISIYFGSIIILSFLLALVIKYLP